MHTYMHILLHCVCYGQYTSITISYNVHVNLLLLECQQAHNLYCYVQSLQLSNEWEDDIEGDLCLFNAWESNY